MKLVKNITHCQTTATYILFFGHSFIEANKKFNGAGVEL